jgi:predicted P-loop ATPase/GTPase
VLYVIYDLHLLVEMRKWYYNISNYEVITDSTQTVQRQYTDCTQTVHRLYTDSTQNIPVTFVFKWLLVILQE